MLFMYAPQSWPLCLRSRNTIHGQNGPVLQVVKPPTGPRPATRLGNQTSLHRIIVHVIEFFEPLLLAPNVQVVSTPLPNTVMSVVVHAGRQFKPRQHLLAPGKFQVVAQIPQDEIGRALCQLLHDLRGIGQLRGPDEEVAVLRQEDPGREQKAGEAVKELWKNLFTTETQRHRELKRKGIFSVSLW